MRRVFLWIGGALFAYCSAAVIGALVPGSKTTLPDTVQTTEIVLVAGPIHYDILLPLDAPTRARLAWLTTRGIQMDHPQATWLSVGWGAHGFYTTTGDYTDLRASTVWHAITGDSAVLRVSLAGTLPNDIRARRLPLSTTQYHALLDTIEASLTDSKDTHTLDLDGFSEFDRFFPALGTFHIFNTCNVWIGRTLRKAGIRFGAWTPTPYAVSLSLAVFH